MKISNIETMVVIEPDNTDNYLTQSNDSIEIQNRIYSKKIYLAINDKTENYKEINKTEYDAFQALLKKYNDEMMSARTTDIH